MSSAANIQLYNRFVVNLDDVWPMVGFTHKHKVKSFVMRKRFIENEDYTLVTRFPQRVGAHIDPGHFPNNLRHFKHRMN